MSDFKSIVNLRKKNKELENKIEEIEISMIKNKIEKIFKIDVLFYTIPFFLFFLLFLVFFAVQGYIQNVNFNLLSDFFTADSLRNVVYLEFLTILTIFFIRLKREEQIKKTLDLFKDKNKIKTKVHINYLYSGYDLSFLAFLLIISLFDLATKNDSLFPLYTIILCLFPMIGIQKKRIHLKKIGNKKNKVETTNLVELKENRKIGKDKENDLIFNLIKNKEKIKSILSYYKEEKMTEEENDLFNLIIKELEEKNKVIINKNKKIKKVNDLYENIFNEETKVNIITE